MIPRARRTRNHATFQNDIWDISYSYPHCSVPESQEVPEAPCGRGRGPIEVDARRRGGGVGTAEMD